MDSASASVLPPRHILEIDIRERQSVVIADDETGVVVFLDNKVEGSGGRASHGDTSEELMVTKIGTAYRGLRRSRFQVLLADFDRFPRQANSIALIRSFAAEDAALKKRRGRPSNPRGCPPRYGTKRGFDRLLRLPVKMQRALLSLCYLRAN